MQNPFSISVSEVIKSPSNPRIKELVRLRNSPRTRTERGLFVAQGMDELEILFHADKEVKEIFYCEEKINNIAHMEQLERWKEKKVPLQKLEIDAFEKASYGNNLDGIVAVFKKWSLDLPSSYTGKSDVIVVLDEVEKPGNLGAVLRTAEAFGAEIVLLSEPSVDFFNPNVVRSSRGLMAKVPVFSGTKKMVFDWLIEKEFILIGTSSKSQISIYEKPCRIGTAFVMGSEKTGLGSFWKSKISNWMKIPLLGEASSINLNASVACLLAEFNRSNSRC